MNFQEEQEFNAFLATEVMGWKLEPDPSYHGLGGAMFAVGASGERHFMWHLCEHVYSGEMGWQPTRNLESAWAVLRALQFKHVCLEVRPYVIIPEQGYRISISNGVSEVDYVTGKDICIAICEAAKQAVELDLLEE